MVSGLRAGAPRNRGSIPGRGTGLIIVTIVQSGFENHPANYSMETSGSGLKRLMYTGDQLPHAMLRSTAITLTLSPPALAT
jgi:hypothetical protein